MLKNSSIVALIFLLLTCSVFATEVLQGKQRIVYKYKKYEKFDFDEIGIEGDTGSPGDLSVNQRYQRKFRNKLRYRKNFKPEIRKAVERLR